MLTTGTLLGFLAFRAEAIKQVARSRAATYVGALFVVSAGFAREYDGEYLVAQPWHLLIPLVASVLGCLLLTVLVWLVALRRQVTVSFAATFASLLNLYWMTAPLAWLYAIPVERFLSPADATRVNLALLALVAAWRVALMIRSVSVIYHTNPFAAAMPVLLFSDVIAWTALRLVPGPVFMIMGGIRLTESEEVLLGTRLLIEAACILSLPIWLIGYIVLLFGRKRWQWQLEPQQLSPDRASMAVSCLVAASLVVWIPILPLTQPEQGLRWQLEGLLRSERFAEVCEVARQHQVEDLPPHWDAPPRAAYGETEPHLVTAAMAIKVNSPPDWLWQLFEAKLDWSSYSAERRHAVRSLRPFSDEELARYVALVSDLENRQEVASMLQPAIEEELAAGEGTMSDERQQLLDRLQAFRIDANTGEDQSTNSDGESGLNAT